MTTPLYVHRRSCARLGLLACLALICVALVGSGVVGCGDPTGYVPGEITGDDLGGGDEPGDGTPDGTGGDEAGVDAAGPAQDAGAPGDVIGPGPDVPEGDPFEGLVAVYPTGCVVTGEPTPPPALKLEPVLTAAPLFKPVQLEVVPDGTGRVVVVSQAGRLMLADGVTAGGGATVWLDITGRVDDGPNEGGLLGLAFHPDFADNGYLFVNYTRTPNSGPDAGQLQTAISRFTVGEPTSGAPDPDSELLVLTIDQPYGNHNGGGVAFGPDGMLYIGTGDGGWAGDPLDAGQDLGMLLAKMLRIDIDELDVSGHYAVPADNPFVGVSGARGEIWAYGLRNPWRFSFDPVDGKLWVGDVGQNQLEEIDIVVAGGNYGWNTMEGTKCYNAASCDTDGLLLPVDEYSHSLGKSVTGGHVYRGSAMPSLYGTYIFGDFEFGTIWGLKPDGAGEWNRTKLLDTSTFPSAFGVGPDGEMYVLDWISGGVSRLAAADPDAVGAPGWPPTLSDTGCFSDLAGRSFIDGVLPYDVGSPLWSDGAGKERGIALPDGTTIGFTSDGAWTFPDGTILIKTFLDPSFPAGDVALETRFLVRDGDLWRGATYRWNEAGADAVLLSADATAELANGETWVFPSRPQCTGCHTPAAGFALGLSTPQMNVDHDIVGVGAVNQIEALAAVGYLVGAPADIVGLPSFAPAEDASVPVADRARAYLQANCAHCHQPGGLGNATIDLRWTATLEATGACAAAPQQGDMGVAGAQIVAPGDADTSVLWLRMVTLDPEVRMPNLASTVVDDAGAAVIEAWIDGLAGCEGP